MGQGRMNERKLSRRSGKAYDKEYRVRDCEATPQALEMDGAENHKNEKATRSFSVDMTIFPVSDCNPAQTFPLTSGKNAKHVAPCAQDVESAMKKKNHDHPKNFGTVAPGLFRCSFPTNDTFDYLEVLGLKTILSLVKKDFTPEFQDFVTRNSITHTVIDMPGTKKVEIPGIMMKDIMDILLDKTNYPILIHCNQGKHRTGCVVAAFRHELGWEVEKIVHEYTVYAAPKVRECDVKYITNFSHAPCSSDAFLPASTTRLHSPAADQKVRRMLVLAIILISIFWGLHYFRQEKLPHKQSWAFSPKR